MESAGRVHQNHSTGAVFVAFVFKHRTSARVFGILPRETSPAGTHRRARLRDDLKKLYFGDNCTSCASIIADESVDLVLPSTRRSIPSATTTCVQDARAYESDAQITASRTPGIGRRRRMSSGELMKVGTPTSEMTGSVGGSSGREHDKGGIVA